MIGPDVDDVVVHGSAPRRTWRRRCSEPRTAVSEADAGAAAAPPPQDFSRLLARLAPGEDPAHVEAWMRSEHGALEDVDALHFAREVKRAVARIHARDTGESDELARSYGLEPRPVAAHRVAGGRRTSETSAIAS